MPKPYPGQQWKHGWIPMTPTAVKSKNHGRGGNRDVIARIAAEAGAVLKRMESGSKPGTRGSAKTPAKAPTKAVASKGAGQDTSKKIDDAIRKAAGRTPPETPPSPPKATAKNAPMAVPLFAQDHHRNLNGIEDLAAAVAGGYPPRERRALTGGVSADTELVTLKDGTKVVHKIGGNPDAEQASSMIAQALGLRAPRVYRDSQGSVYMDYIDDAITADELKETNELEYEARRRAAGEHDDDNLVGLLDVLISNADRNTGNWMLTADGRTIPIDHGHAFAGVPDHGRVRVGKVRGDGNFAANFTDGPNPLTKADVAEVRRRLEALRPDFEHMKRGTWLDYSLAVLAKLEPHASGYWSMLGASSTA